MKFALCGAGRVGTSLAYSLKAAGWGFYGYYSTSFPDWVKKEERIDKLDELKERNLLVLIALPDREIKRVSKKLPSFLIVGHTSGSLDHTAIHAPSPRGIFSLHPLRSVPKYRMNLSHGFWGIEGDRVGIETAKKIVRVLKGRYLVVDTDKKPLYHLAAVLSTNLTTSLLFLAHKLFEKCGIQKGIDLYLGETTIKNIKDMGYLGSLTGPVERGDYLTIKRDLQSLKDFAPESLATVVKLLDVNLELAKEKGLEEEYADRIHSIISDYSKF